MEADQDILFIRVMTLLYLLSIQQTENKSNIFRSSHDIVAYFSLLELELLMANDEPSVCMSML
ncbi:hypothetical protein A33Q_4626 [Indibacter alkaliphilus LW1]|uniref:Uncharacterized protein n=1 Tax=Indibacter alkaliphilus (strain CCUG 57479 / KCTC 22604 / LW1) TaxID=1189612 RepID=S2DP50_INDAL|nr:hypothetical protein [Indibacter alkaliphilus]EOZ91558.1 hypothetical protein A33Q_4626 [Indibacter alkaliphilus LW1]